MTDPTQAKVPATDTQRRAHSMLAARGWFPSAGAVPYDIAHSLLIAALSTPPAPLREADIDWLATAKAAGRYGVRYSTNARLVDFINDVLAFAARPAGEVERLREAEGVARRWAEHYAGGDGEQRRMERLCGDIADEIAALVTEGTPA